MNKYSYSPSENAFYAVALKNTYELSGTWPSDALDIPDNISAEYMAESPEGKLRIAGDDGYPIWIDKPEPTLDELIAAANAEKQERIVHANDYMNSKQWPGKAALGRLKGDELTQYTDWLDYLDALEAVNSSSVPIISWPTPPVEQAN
ncbi:MAG: tail fiber assembly protein [Enterobacter asburiae]|uniref:tail fiber assembly protein n=1 Tax=Enterobacter mori TaxID=539813 RepID=UPI002909CB27|nr:tail fiber assembly protein [Enterobacter asburiae]